MSVVLDTTVLIDVLRAHPPALEFLAGLDDAPACSELSRIEVIRGLREDERPSAERLFTGLAWHPVDEPVARLAGELGQRWRSSHTGIGTVDLVVAATAGQLNMALATTNVRHFPMFEGLQPPY